MEITTKDVKDFLVKYQGQVITLDKIRNEMGVEKSGLGGIRSKSFDAVRNIMFRLAEQKVVKTLSRGEYKVVREVKPITVFGRERRPPITLLFPKDEAGMEMLFAEDIVMREGDLILISGQSNFGKTQLCLAFCAENIDSSPVLMGNEYTTLDGEPSARFLNRIDNMDWVEWIDGNNQEKFVLLPVREDYAEHIVKGKINIIDWINLPGEYYMISPVMEGIKRELGRGIGIIAIQKNPGVEYGRGGNLTKDFADVEILLDQYGEHEVLLTIGKVKEYKHFVMGRTFAYSISQGVKILNFREVKRCPACRGQGYTGGKQCTECDGKKFVDK